MSFDKLIGDMELMSKAQTLDAADKDAKAAAAAAAAGPSGDGDKGGEHGAGGEGGTQEAAGGSAHADGGKGAGEGQGAQKAAGTGTDEEMGKSFTIVLENGEAMEAFDGTAMLKALGDKVGSVGLRLDSTEGKVKEALGKAILLIGGQSEVINTLSKSLSVQGALVNEQADLIKSLRVDLDAVRSQPAGRKSVTSPGQFSTADPLVKSMGNDGGTNEMAPQEFLTKCLSLQKEGLMSLQDVAIAEASLGANVPIPAHISAKVFSK